jgi:hypothetical protein
VLDVVIDFRKASDRKAEDGAAFKICYEKSRGFYGNDAAPFEPKLITDEHTGHCWAMRCPDTLPLSALSGC